MNSTRFGVNNGIEYVLLSENDFEECKKVLNAFLTEESVCIGCEVNLPESFQARADLIRLCEEVVKDGVTIIAKDELTGEVVGVSFNKLQYPSVNIDEPSYFEKFANENCKSENSKTVMKFMIDVDGNIDLFKYYNTNCLLEIMFLATLPSHRGRSIGLHLSEYSIQLANDIKLGKQLHLLPKELQMKRPTIVSAIYTSKYSQVIGNKLNFDIVFEDDFKKMTFNGKPFSDRIGAEHLKWQLAVKKL